MKTFYALVLFLFFQSGLTGQGNTIAGSLKDSSGESILYANVLLNNEDGTLAKVATTDDDGAFAFVGISPGSYRLLATYVGYADLNHGPIIVNDSDISLGTLTFDDTSVELETATVTARRAIVEVKADRTVFNVEGTINAAGSNGIELLRKAPGVLVDNNENITVMGRSGVQVYVDGKRLPINGDDLTNYLRNLTASQIDKIDIITNPGAKYEAEGNAGIIDIRLKRIKEVGANGTVSTDVSMGQFHNAALNGSFNYKNGNISTFGSAGVFDADRFNDIVFRSEQNSLYLIDTTRFMVESNGLNGRFGLDYALGQHSTIGFLVSAGSNVSDISNFNQTKIATLAARNQIDSILVAENTQDTDQDNQAYNLNYVYQNKETSLNIDLDYAKYDNFSSFYQPNNYYSPDYSTIYTTNINEYTTPVNIDISTAKLDYETGLQGGKLGTGIKLSNVETENLFKLYDYVGDEPVFNTRRSNDFNYSEKVYAGYANYARQLTQKWNMSAGLRVEVTDAVGDLRAYEEDLQEDPVDLDYTNFFPSLGLTYQQAFNKVWSINYGRRINRPDYNVLNPFEIQMSELSFMKGSESLRPEIVNNVELGYTYNFMYNFKLSYSKTTDQITRLIGPDDRDPRANFISWDNIASQTIWAFNFSAPVQIKSWWNAYFNVNVSHLDNQADYGNGAVVDVQAFSYSLYQQQTFTLGKGFTGEISGYYGGPGIWGGVFEYDPSYSLNVGIQKKFLNDRLNVKLSGSDLTYQTGWSGFSRYNGLFSEGRGNWDSRRIGLSMSYNLGSKKYKARKRKTGAEAESKRVSQS